MTWCNRRGRLPSLCHVRPRTSDQYRCCCTFFSRVLTVFVNTSCPESRSSFVRSFRFFGNETWPRARFWIGCLLPMVPPTDLSQRLCLLRHNPDKKRLWGKILYKTTSICTYMYNYWQRWRNTFTYSGKRHVVMHLSTRNKSGIWLCKLSRYS